MHGLRMRSHNMRRSIRSDLKRASRSLSRSTRANDHPDLIRMGRQHVKDGRINVRQQKTGTRLWLPIHPDLKAIMDATPSDHLTFLVSELGKPYKSAGSFGQRMKLWAREAGLIGCPLHGLRKVSLRRLAEAGCSAPEIMAISGHKSLAEVERYIKSAEQTVMADRAIARTETYPRADLLTHGIKRHDKSILSPRSLIISSE